MVNYLALNGNIRKDMGSSNTNRLRKEGMIPAVIYGMDNNENIYLSVIKKEFDKEYLKGGINVRPIELNIDGKKYKVLTYQIDLDPVSDMPRHIDFMFIDGKKEIKAYIPVNYVGRDKSPGLKRGGFLNVLKRKIQCCCDPLNIPTEIIVDISKAHIGDKIKIETIKLPNGIRTVDKSNFNVCTITGRGKSTTAETPAEGTAPAAAAPAKTEAKPAAKK
jgi:large subunit ribosomal protein L25